uniref:Uncharacterized protein n=1 Tax=Arion vulgaris TaxID=1028688 RepID=A0A0B7AE62_9EUPU
MSEKKTDSRKRKIMTQHKNSIRTQSWNNRQRVVEEYENVRMPAWHLKIVDDYSQNNILSD